VFLLSPAESRAITAAHRLATTGVTMQRALASFSVDGRSFRPGTLVVDAGGAAGRATAVESVVQELGLTAHRTGAVPSARLERVRLPRIGIYHPWTANMDEGWTRWLLDHYGVPYRTLTNDEIRTGALAEVDVVLFAGQSAQSILDGRPAGGAPDRYVGGVGQDGVRALARFVAGGGRLVALDNANDFLIRHFDIPVGNSLAGLRRAEFFIPGSLVRLQVDPAHPVGFGMPDETAAFFQDSRAFEIVGAGPEVVARYAERDILLSGWEVGADEYLAGQPAVVRVPHGAGELVLIGFRAQFRAQPAATFKLLFNALH
jgi:hypothetical protein